MGFKKTSEGRVFFKSPDNDDTPSKPIKTADSKPVISKNNTQMQILLLLKSLNTKLKNSKDDNSAIKSELTDYKATIKSLEEKTAKQQSDYIDLEQKVANKQNEASKKSTRVENSVKKTLEQLENAKTLVKELEEKTENHDKTLKGIKDNVKKQIEDQNKKAANFERKQKSLEAVQKDQSEKMVSSVATYVALTKRVGDAETRQDALDNKIEDTSSEYLKLDRKIDKVIEDRNRILRKVERIEQAVLETRDALNAKAMVLLTDQGVSGVSMPQITDEALQTDPMALHRRIQEEALMPWWRRPVRLQTTSLVLLMLVVLLLGWLMSAANRPAPIQVMPPLARATPPPTVNLGSTINRDNDRETMLGQEATLKIQEENTTQKTGYASAQPDFGLSYNEQEDINSDMADQAREVETNNDTNSSHGITIHKGFDNPAQIKNKNTLDINNDAQMLAAMKKSPEQVAQRLNQIEPASISMDYVPSAYSDSLQKMEEEIAAPAPLRIIDSAYKAELKIRISPDPNLTGQAKKIERKAFEGVPEAQHDLGALYVSGHDKIERNLSRAILWFQEAADNGIANAKYNLGVLYHQGMGVDVNLDKAIQLYTEAAQLNHPEAQYNLGIANIEGIGVPYNPKKAAYYFEKAAHQNINEAAYNLGLIYENGLLGEAKPDLALTWYKHAADTGSPEARSAMEQLATSLGVSMEDINRIIENVKRSNASFPSEKNNKSLISKTQGELMRRGLYPGPVDGVIGPMTRNAIEAFQKAANLEVTGEASDELLLYLSASSSNSKL